MKKPLLVVEIIGPAGSGKTTLLQTLRRCDEKFQMDIYLNNIKYIPIFILYTLLLLPIFLRPFRNGRWFTWREVKLIVHLKMLHHVFKRHTLKNRGVIILDQGPVYKLARLLGSGSGNFKNQHFEAWWTDAIDQWASVLDLVIQLDAPDGILLERIRVRDKWHSVKGKSEQEAYKFLAYYRTSHEQVIAKLTAQGGPRVLRFDTGQEALDQIVDKVLAAFDLEHRER